jgi:hypothetical protein
MENMKSSENRSNNEFPRTLFRWQNLEARVEFKPTNRHFADLSRIAILLDGLAGKSTGRLILALL